MAVKIKFKRRKTNETKLNTALGQGGSLYNLSVDPGEPIDLEIQNDKYLILGSGDGDGSAVIVSSLGKAFLKARTKDLVDKGLFIRTESGNKITLRKDDSDTEKILDQSSGGTGSSTLHDAINSLAVSSFSTVYKTTISFTPSSPTLVDNVYSYDISISEYSITVNTKVDIQPNVSVLSRLEDDGISAMWVENNSNNNTPSLSLKCLDAPLSNSSFSIQCTLYEVRQ